MQSVPLHKHAEPPPPKGVSVKAWDKILQGLGPEKVKEADGYRRSMLAETAGRIKGNKERSTAANVGSGTASAYGNLLSMDADIGRKLPVKVGLGNVISHIPNILKARGDKNRAMTSLQHFNGMSAGDRAKIEKNLNSRVAGEVAGTLVDAILNTGLAHARYSGTALPPLTGYVAGKGLGHLVRKGVQKSTEPESLVSDAAARKFLQRAGVSGTLYVGKEGLSKSKYHAGTKDPIFSGIRGMLIQRHLENAKPGTGEKILREGGIIVPREKSKAASATWTALASNFN